MVAIHTDARSGMDCGSRAADENRAWYQILQVPLGSKQSFPVGQRLRLRSHAAILTRPPVNGKRARLSAAGSDLDKTVFAESCLTYPPRMRRICFIAIFVLALGSLSKSL